VYICLVLDWCRFDGRQRSIDLRICTDALQDQLPYDVALKNHKCTKRFFVINDRQVSKMCLQCRSHIMTHMAVQGVVSFLRKCNDLIIPLDDFRVVEAKDVAEHAYKYCEAAVLERTPFIMTRKLAFWESCELNKMLSSSKERVNIPSTLVKASSIHLLIRLNVEVAHLGKWFDGLGLLGYWVPNFHRVKVVLDRYI
jgi:hypothetical protein